MKIAIDTSPVSSSSKSMHKVRGVGSYINLLKENLAILDKNNKYFFFDDNLIPPGADIVHYPYFEPFFISLPKKRTKKTVVTVHDLTPIVFKSNFPVGLKGTIKWFIQKSRLKNVDKIITDSISSKKDIERIVGIPGNKVKVVYLAASREFVKIKNQDWKSEFRKKFNLPEKFILYVGDATWNKNLPNLAEAILKTPYALVFVGKVWGEKKIDRNSWNKDLIYTNSLIDKNNQLIRLGFLENSDLVRIYNLADALIMPSIYEGFGLPILEAMRCGCPVISSRGGSLPEVGGEAVCYIDGKNIEDIVVAVKRIMADTSLRRQMSQEGLTQARKFTVEKSIKDLIKVYEE